LNGFISGLPAAFGQRREFAGGRRSFAGRADEARENWARAAAKSP
jgi:hypothetical protein